MLIATQNSELSLGHVLCHLHDTHTRNWTLERLGKNGGKTATVPLTTASLNSLRTAPGGHKIQVVMPSFVGVDRTTPLGTVSEMLDASMKISGVL